MSRTTPLTHLCTARASRLLLAGAVTATTFVVAGAASADDANPWALKSAGPAYLSTVSPARVTLTGKGFTSGSVVTFTHCLADPTTVAPATAPAVEGRGSKLVVTPPACAAGSQPRIKVVTDGRAESTRILYTSKITYVEKPELVAVSPVAPATGPWTGGTVATVTLRTAPVAKAPVQVRFGTGNSAKAVSAKARAEDPRKFVFKTPPGTPGGTSASVTVFGIASDPVANAFDYSSTIKVSPSSWVAGAEAPLVKIAGAGFGSDAGGVTVTVCGTPVDASAVLSVTDKAITFTPPAAAALQLTGGVGACTVAVTAGARQSLVTAGSTFTYASY